MVYEVLQWPGQLDQTATGVRIYEKLFKPEKRNAYPIRDNTKKKTYSCWLPAIIDISMNSWLSNSKADAQLDHMQSHCATLIIVRLWIPMFTCTTVVNSCDSYNTLNCPNCPPTRVPFGHSLFSRQNDNLRVTRLAQQLRFNCECAVLSAVYVEVRFVGARCMFKMWACAFVAGVLFVRKAPGDFFRRFLLLHDSLVYVRQ